MHQRIAYVVVLAALFVIALGVLAGPVPRPSFAQAGTIYYVDKTNGNDTNNGLAWNTAKRNLQSALALAPAGAEIWVAAGTYYPDEGTGESNDDRDATFELKDGVAIYGGFAGTETLRIQSDPATNVTILSGDLQQNDTANFGNSSDNAYHVVGSFDNAATALLSGFTITAGNANGDFPDNLGGGIFIFTGGQAQFTSIVVGGNQAAALGGGVYNDSGSPSFTDVTISSNRAAALGGGVYNDSGSPSFTDVTIS
ncbi:MAG: hypothetical protein HC911_18105, partial [Chloroflexaceae bacterium]|nr:hypothetical protein [Chloroflexaceae bacterium]